MNSVEHILYDAAITSATKDKITIKWAKEYSAPDLSYGLLRQLVEHFGTEEIDVESDINRGGCETCDYGSLYGHTITVHKPTRNIP